MDIDDGYILWTGIWKGKSYESVVVLVNNQLTTSGFHSSR